MRIKKLHSPVLQRRNLEYLGKLHKKNFEERGMASHDALNKLKESIDELHVISNEWVFISNEGFCLQTVL